MGLERWHALVSGRDPQEVRRPLRQTSGPGPNKLQTRGSATLRRVGLACLLGMLPLAAVTGCGSGYAGTGLAIPALPGEDLAGPCRYSLVTNGDAGQQPGGQELAGVQQGVLVIFERSDTAQLMEDASVRAMAEALHFAILWARQCDARSSGDLQADAAKGPARTLRAALSTFATATGHPELGTVPLVLFGFSAAGVLSATMETAWPDRLAGVVLYAAGSAYTDLDTVAVTAKSAAIPTLILTNAEDQKSGTSRSYRYFMRGQAQGAQWGYGVQNNTDHCCSLSTRSILLPWLQAIAMRSGSAATSVPVSFTAIPDGTIDAQGEMDSDFNYAGMGAGVMGQQTAWLPDAVTAKAWVAWVTNPETN